MLLIPNICIWTINSVLLKEVEMYEIGLVNSEQDLHDVIDALNERGGDLLRSGPLSFEALSNRSIKALLNPEQTIIIIVRDDQEVVATMMVCFRQTWRKEIGTVEYVYTDANHRRRGLAGMMFYFALKIVRDRQTSRLELTSKPSRKPARAFYRKLGFKLVEGSDRHFVLDL